MLVRLFPTYWPNFLARTSSLAFFAQTSAMNETRFIILSPGQDLTAAFGTLSHRPSDEAGEDDIGDPEQLHLVSML
jgi:hypothetical protein